jgi:hypothetical protein
MDKERYKLIKNDYSKNWNALRTRCLDGGGCQAFSSEISCSLRRKNRFKAPRKNLGALLFSPRSREEDSKLRGKTLGLCCSLRRKNRFKAPRKNLGALLFSPQKDKNAS